jgi:hypothetical protein
MIKKAIKETLLARITREREEKEEKEEKNKKQKEINKLNEIERQKRIVMPYLDNLEDQINNKKAWSFWTFPDRSGFKKLKDMSVQDMQNIINEDPEKYKNRRIAYISMMTYHKNDKPTSLKSKIGTLFAVGISIRCIDDKGILSKKSGDCWGCDFRWTLDDFKTTKFSFKLLERIMIPVAEKRKTCTSLTGTDITDIIKDLEKKKYDFSDVLKPLAGL